MSKITEAVFLAGGMGTRLQSVVKDVPKPMADINGKPFLHYLIRFYARQGISHIVLSVGHLHKRIIDYFGDSYETVRISYAVENHPLGTGGAISNALSYTETDNVFVVNADTMFKVDLEEISHFHKSKNADITLVVRAVDDVSRYGSIVMDAAFGIRGFTEKNQDSGKGFINGGVYLINRPFFNRFDFPEKFSVEKDFFEKHYKNNAFFAKVCPNYFIDIGIPEDYARAQKQFPVLFD